MRQDEILDAPSFETVPEKNKPLLYLLILAALISVLVPYVLGLVDAFGNILAVFLFAVLDFFFQFGKTKDNFKKIALSINLVGGLMVFGSFLCTILYGKNFSDFFVVSLFVLVAYFMTINRSEKSEYTLARLGFSFYGLAYTFFCMIIFFRLYSWPDIFMLYFAILILGVIASFFYVITYLKDREKNWSLLLFLPKLGYLILAVLPIILHLSGSA